MESSPNCPFSFPSIGRVPSSPEPLIGDWEAHCEKCGSQKTSRCSSQKEDVWVSKNIATEVNSTLWWSQAVPYKMTRKLKTGYRSSSSPVNFTKSVNFSMFGNFKMRSGIWRIVELECFQHMSSSGGSSRWLCYFYFFCGCVCRIAGFTFFLRKILTYSYQPGSKMEPLKSEEDGMITEISPNRKLHILHHKSPLQNTTVLTSDDKESNTWSMAMLKPQAYGLFAHKLIVDA